jgi:formate dehydrogenase maturation protein FdhE
MYFRKFLAFAAAFLIALSAIGMASAKTNEQRSLQSIEPLNIAIVVQDISCRKWLMRLV